MGRITQKREKSKTIVLDCIDERVIRVRHCSSSNYQKVPKMVLIHFKLCVLTLKIVTQYNLLRQGQMVF